MSAAKPLRLLAPVLDRVARGGDADFTRVKATCPGLAKAPFVELYTVRDGQAGALQQNHQLGHQPGRGLGPALGLYRAMGFVDLDPAMRPATDYARCDVWMERPV